MSKLNRTPLEADGAARQRIEKNDANKDEFLDLGDLALERLPESIRKVKHLRVLALGKNALLREDHEFLLKLDFARRFHTFKDMSPLAGLTALNHLDLSGCVGVMDLTPLAGMTALNQLNLSDCVGVTDLTPLAGMTALNQLNLSDCVGVRDLTPLAGMTVLELLFLTECVGVTDLTPLAGMTALKLLDLRGCGGVTDLTPLASLTALNQLDLSDCVGVRDLTPLTGLTALNRLDLIRCEGVTDLTPLAGMTALNQLNLNWCEGVTDLTPLAGMTALNRLDLIRCEGVTDLTPLAGMTALNQLDLSVCGGVTDLSPLTSLTGLKQLALSRCQGVTDLSPLTSLTALNQLDLIRCEGVTDLSSLASLTALNQLDLSECQAVTDLTLLAGLTGLNQLVLSRCEGVTDLTPLAGLTALNQLDLSGCKGMTDLTPLAGLTALNQLDLSGCEGVTDLTPLAGLTALNELDLTGCEGVTDLTPLAGLTALNQLDLSECQGVTDLTPLAGLTALNQLDLSECQGVTDLTLLAGLTGLNQLVLSRCEGVTDLTPLAGLTALNQLDLSGCKGMTDLTPLAGLTALNQLDLSGCKGMTDLTPLAGLTTLNQLHLSGCKGMTDLTPLAGLAALNQLVLRGCVGVTGLTPLAGLTALNQLDLRRCEGVTDLTPLAGLTALNQLVLGECQGVTDLTPLAGLTALNELDLRWCEGVTDLTPLAGLTALNELDLTGCEGVTDLTPLAGLTALNQLDLSECQGVTDLTLLAGMTGLNHLVLSRCKGVCWFEPIKHILGQLQELRLFGCRFNDLPEDLYGEKVAENVAGLVRQYYDALKTQGRGEDEECKLLVVGNSAAGKTSLVRLILDKPHRDNEPSSHAIQLEPWYTKILLIGNVSPTSIYINIWDFAGQDIYHETHRLFFQSGAAYLLVWDPLEEERPVHDADLWYTDKKRPLQYWVDQIVSIDPQAYILIARNKADLDGDRKDLDWMKQLPRHQAAIRDQRIQFVRLSARERTPAWRAAHRTLFKWISQTIPTILGGPEKRATGQGRLKVKEELRRRRKDNEAVARSNEVPDAVRQGLPHPFMERTELDELVRHHCKHSTDADDTTPVLQWLHRTGVVFWNVRLLAGRIVIDQRWAIQGIYTLLHREYVYDNLVVASGRFTAQDVAQLAWDDAGYTADEQELFLSFMQSCGLCFQLLTAAEAADGNAIYVAPEYLPEGNEGSVDQARRHLRRGFDGGPKEDVSVVHPFLGEGLAAAMINCVGTQWSRAAVVWRWGVAFAFAAPGKQAVAEVTWDSLPDAELEFGGRLRVVIWGPGASDFLPEVLKAIQGLPGFPQDAKFGHSGSAKSATANPEVWTRQLASVVEGNLPGSAPDRGATNARRLWFSASASHDVPRTETSFHKSLLAKLTERSASRQYRLTSWGYFESDDHKTPMRPYADGDLILVFLTEEYLHSESQIAELVEIYQIGGGKFPKSRARLWRLPSADRHIACEQPNGHGISPTFKDYWGERLADYRLRMTKAVGNLTDPLASAQKYNQKKLSEPHWQLFEFMAENAEWGAFLAALVNHEFEPHPLTGGRVLQDELNSYAERTVEELCRLMTAPDATREPAAPGVGRKAREGLERMGAETEKNRLRLKTFLYVGAILHDRTLDALPLADVSNLCWEKHHYQRSDKKIGEDLRILEAFFASYWKPTNPGRDFDFIDRGRGQGRPPEFLKHAWDMWKETRQFFEGQGLRLDDRNLGPETTAPTQS